MELTRQKAKILSVAGVSILGFFSLQIFVYGPLLREVRLKAKECRKAEIEVDRARLAVNTLKKEANRSTFFSEKEISSAVDDLTRRGKERGINFVSITPGRVEENENVPFHLLPVQLQMESSFKSLGLFLGELDELPKGVMTVRELTILADDKDSAVIKARVNLDLHLRD